MAMLTYPKNSTDRLSQHFCVSEFACKGNGCCGEIKLDGALVTVLELIRQHFGAADLQRIGGIMLNDTCGVEVKHIFTYTVKQKNVLTGVFNLAFGLQLLVFGLKLGKFFLELFHINAAHTEARCHRLTVSVTVSAQLVITAGKRE